jgi:hypothetical protein
MSLAFHGITTIKASLEAAIFNAQQARYSALEIWTKPIFEICSRLKAIAYDGPCAIELFRPNLWECDPLEVVTLARAAALDVLRPHFEIT